jgi:hypothetical protein
MPKTAYSQKFQRELDPEQLLSLFGYDLDSDPDLKNLSGTLRSEIHRDLTCPECGATGGIIVSRSKSQKDYTGHRSIIRQSHFRFLASEGAVSIHHPLCDHYEDSKPKSQKESLVNFGGDRSFETKAIRELVSRGIEQQIFSQQTIRDMRQWFFDTKVENQFNMDISEEALQWASKLSSLVHQHGVPFNPVHAELPDFDWGHAAILQFAEENRNLIDMVRDRWWGYDSKAGQRASRLIQLTQGETVFDITVLAEHYKKTIELARFMKQNLRMFNRKFQFNEFQLHSDKKLASIVAFAALLLYVSSWDFDKAVFNLIKIVKAPAPIDMNAGNVIGLNPFHDLTAWSNIVKAKEIAQHSHKGFDFDAQVEVIEQRLREEYDEWKKSQ